jgi:type II secretory pathway pseudopilin PulG
MNAKKNFKSLERLSNEKGFTLLELVVSGALLTVIMLSVFSVTVMSQQIFTDNGVYARLTQGGMETLRHVGREVGQTGPNTNPDRITITADGNGSSVLCFQIPVDWDNDGDVITAAMNPVVEWGAYDWVGQTTNGRLRLDLLFVDNTADQLIRDVRDSALAPLVSIVANNVQFVAARNTDHLTMITLQAADTVGRME